MCKTSNEFSKELKYHKQMLVKLRAKLLVKIYKLSKLYPEIKIDRIERGDLGEASNESLIDILLIFEVHVTSKQRQLKLELESEQL